MAAKRHPGSLRCTLALLLCAALAACAQPGVRNESTASRRSTEKVDRAVYLDLIRKMLDQNQYYAALAHIQQQQAAGQNNDELRYLEAEARRQLGQFAAAEALYRGLLRTKLVADAYHGLGLLYAPVNLGVAIANLRESTKRQPTDATARNDLGYALLKARRYKEALPELATAVELDPANDKARNNLLLLLLATRDEPGAQRVIASAAVPPETVARLRREALALQQPVLPARPAAVAPKPVVPPAKQPARTAAGVKKS